MVRAYRLGRHKVEGVGVRTIFFSPLTDNEFYIGRTKKGKRKLKHVRKVRGRYVRK